MDIKTQTPMRPIDADEAKAMVDTALAQLQNLTVFGLDDRDRTGSREQTDLYSPSGIRGVQLCASWLTLQSSHTPGPGYWVRLTVNRRTTSHTLVMACRGWAGEYISDGSMVVAILAMNFEWESRPYDSNICVVLRKRPGGKAFMKERESK